MEEYTTRESYLEALLQRGGLPGGFKAASVPLSFFPEEKILQHPMQMDLSAIILDEATTAYSGMFTRNAVQGAPVVIGRGLVDESGKHPVPVRGVLINNRIANVCAPGGEEAAQRVLETFAKKLAAGREAVFPASTGIIGWKLPVDAMCRACGPLADKLSDAAAGDQRNVLSAARGIMTTDAYPKVRSLSVGEGRIVGIAKGAGMIEPNMGTMLVFLMTDVSLDGAEADLLLRGAVEESFNRISVDSDQSTSDMALLFSSRKKPRVEYEAFRNSLAAVCTALAVDIVRNGEGTKHVLKITVDEADSDEAAAGLAKAVCNSPLVKTAIFGNDPNVGRILMAAGNYAGVTGTALDLKKLGINIGGFTVFEKGAFRLSDEGEKQLSGYLERAFFDNSGGFPPHDRTVDITLRLGTGKSKAVVWGSDLSYDYIQENADYRS